MRALLALAIGLPWVACGGRLADPRDQWTVTISTDAPVPQFGDRLLVEVLNERGEPACSGCRRQFGVGEKSSWPVSFGVASTSAGTYRVRARLYRAASAGADGLPSGIALIDALGTLPPARGETPVSLPLSMRCFGVAANVGDRTTCDRATGALAREPELTRAAALPIASWPPALKTPCALPPLVDGDDMRCVPGGAFLLGAPAYIAIGDRDDPTPERVVQLSPFALDVDELTVGAFRAIAARVTGRPTARSGDSRSRTAACTYLGDSDPTNDALPLNCVSFDLASSICAALDKRLPTEAEWEWAAGNRDAETTHPWGADADTCTNAIVGRGRTAFESDVQELATCRGSDDKWGPVAGGAPRDVTALGVKNLGGNVAEWVAVGVDGYASPCWQPMARLLIDPVCAPGETASPGMRAVRGGHWAGAGHFTRAYHRAATISGAASPNTGVRCARSAAAAR